ncbi:MAG: caspase family protein [Chlorobi bacterium]|nr:caspase family protein [Chlorobiota bacterium]
MPGNNRRNLTEETEKTSDSLSKSEAQTEDTMSPPESDALACSNTETEHETRGARLPFNKTETNTPRNKFNGVNYLLLIAIDDYDEDITGCSPLKNPVRDAENFKKILKERYGYEEKNIINLLNEDATKDVIIETVNSMVKNMTKNDQILIYFSGHGCGSEQTLYVAPFNCNKKKKATSFIEIKDLFEPKDPDNLDILKNFGSLLLIIDACHSGASQIGISQSSKEGRPRELLMSCRAEELALDESAFSKALCEFLESNVQKIRFKAENLSGFINSKFEKLMAQTGHRQELQYAPAPSKDNAPPAFEFNLSDNERVSQITFTETIIKELNFSKERQFFKEIDLEDAQVNYNYYIISSASHSTKIESTRCNIFSRELTKRQRQVSDFTIDFFRTQCFHINLSQNPTINHFLVSINKKLGNDQSAEFENILNGNGDNSLLWKFFISKVGSHFVLKKGNEYPFLLAFIFENPTTTSFEVIKSFINILMEKTEVYRTGECIDENTVWSPLMINLISDCSKPNLDPSDKKCVNKDHINEILNRYGNPSFKFFDRVEELDRISIDNWLTELNTIIGDNFVKNTYRKVILDLCPRGSSIEYYDFIDKASDIILRNKTEIYSKLFFNKL